jgi:hypothetical protein
MTQENVGKKPTRLFTSFHGLCGDVARGRRKKWAF